MTETRIIQKPNDPLCLRISAGGSLAIGFYCVLRGSGLQAVRNEAILCLEEILKALKNEYHPIQQEDDGQ